MSKNCRFRGPLDKQHGKRAQACLKSSSQHLYDIHWVLLSQLRRKRSLLFTCKILVLFVNTLAPNGRYPVLNRGNLVRPIQTQLFQKQNTFSGFLTAFFKFGFNFKYFQKKKKNEPDRFCIFEITDSERGVISMSKRCRFWEPLHKQHVKRSQALLKSPSQNFYHIHWSMPSQLSRKKSILLACQILGLLVNKLHADVRYPVLNRENLTISIQMQLRQKQKTFSPFCAAFLKSRLKFKYFGKKDDPYSFYISRITDSENVVR